MGKRKPGPRPQEPYVMTSRQSEAFEAYYKTQGIVGEDEWDQFMDSLRKPLPTTFRITGHRQTAAWIKSQLTNVFNPLLPPEAAVRPIAWYPDGLGWCMASDRKTLRTVPAYQEFHAWLVAIADNGDVSRQEAVSMVPPLLLDVQPDHLVLDMCAAPGSKTAQLVELVHRNGNVPGGMVVANDVHQQRAYMLHHQVKRILSPCLLVTNNDGTFYPNVFMDGPESAEAVQFDRILCDVPCSGDGTLRKNLGLWDQWTCHLGLGLHAVQLRLLDRGLQMAKVGGRLVYSTCSLNPVENEAVVAAILTKYRGKAELVDVSDQLLPLRRRPGLETWKVLGREGQVFDSLASIPEALRRRYPETVFPPVQPCHPLHLHRAVRILPHLQDTGGFFVAVIAKTAELSPSAPDHRRRRPCDSPLPDKNDDLMKRVRNKLADEPFILVDPHHPNLQSALAFYRIDPTGGAFLCRSDREPIKTLTFVSNSVRRLLLGNNHHLKLVNCGIRAFELYDLRPLDTTTYPCPYRLLMESASLFAPLLAFGLRKFSVPAVVLASLLRTEHSIPIHVLGVSAGVENGGLLLVCDEKPQVLVPVWQSPRGIKAFVPKENRSAILLQLDG